MAVPYVFAFQTLPIPLAQLDVNFNTPITVGTTDVQLGDTITALVGMASIGVSGAVTAGSFVGPLTGNAATVTNGVYTVGDQTIDGVKTFVSTILGNIDGNATTVTNGVYISGSYENPAWITGLSGAKITEAIDGIPIGLTTPAAAQFTYAYTGTILVTQSTSSITVNCALSNVFETTLTESITVLALSNPHDGQTINWFITQDGTGSRTMAWGSSVKFPGGAAEGVLSTAAAAVDLAVLTYRASTGLWYGSIVKAFS